MKCRCVAATVIWCLFLDAALAAQAPARPPMAGFEQKKPAVGEPLPEVRLFNAAGQEVNLSSLRGQYTVLVFGCLT
jgi:cytochrome oxidase Cu insertion factor (SCO1/SenC/PrrC family)